MNPTLKRCNQLYQPPYYHFSPEDGKCLFMRNVGMTLRVYTAPQPRTSHESFHLASVSRSVPLLFNSRLVGYGLTSSEGIMYYVRCVPVIVTRFSRLLVDGRTICVERERHFLALAGKSEKYN